MSQSITDPDTHVSSWKASGLSQAAYYRQAGQSYIITASASASASD